MAHPCFFHVDKISGNWKIRELNTNDKEIYESLCIAITERNSNKFLTIQNSSPQWKSIINRTILVKTSDYENAPDKNVAMNLCHLAAISHSRLILKEMLENGGDLSICCVEIDESNGKRKFTLKESVFDLIMCYFREPVEFIRNLLNESIECNDMGSSYEYTFNFAILQPPSSSSRSSSSSSSSPSSMHLKPYDQENFNNDDDNASGRQMTVLNSILNSTDNIHSEQYELLKHPLIEAYLTCKWKHYRRFFFLLVLLHLSFVLCLSSAVILIVKSFQWFHNESVVKLIMRNFSNEEEVNDRGRTPSAPSPTSAPVPASSSQGDNIFNIGNNLSDIIIDQKIADSFKFTMRSICLLDSLALICATLLLIHAVIQANFIPLKKLLRELEVILNLLTAPCALLKCIFVIIMPYDWYFDSSNRWIFHLSSFIILPAWINLMLIVGRFPRLGCYSLMFTTVLQNFLKVMTSFVFLIVGFAISFSLMFPNSEFFNNPAQAILRTVVMMVGEFDYVSTFSEEEDKFLSGTSRVIFLFFIISCSIILMNLTQGIAVNDIKLLHEISQVIRLEKETRFLYELESVFTHSLIVSHPFLRKIKQKLYDRGISIGTMKVTRDNREGLCNEVYERLMKDFKPSKCEWNRRMSFIRYSPRK